MTVTNPFDAGPDAAAAYDAWYDSSVGNSVLLTEEVCVRQLLAGAPRPWLEIGTGSGRFGGDLGADIGLDPALELLRIAGARMPCVVRGVAETLPFRDACLGVVMAVTVLEFLASPQRAMHEVARVLRPDGRFVLGFIPQDGPWGKEYELQGSDAESVFHQAHFFSVEELVSLAAEAGLRVTGAFAARLHSRGKKQSGIVKEIAGPEAGFIALAFALASGREGETG